MNYVLTPSKRALVYEVLLPKKMSYASKLAEVLDAFLTEEGVQEIPAVKNHLEGLLSKEERSRDVLRIREVIKGYSIYEVDGRFAVDNEPVDERSWVIRFIIHDPQIEGANRTDFLTLAKTVVEYLIAHRFAEELGNEDEIWFLQYEHCSLRRWVKPKGGSNND